MSQKNLLIIKNWIKRNCNSFTIILTLSLLLLTIPLVLVFVFVLNRTWADGLTVASIIYIGVGLLIIIFTIAQFKTITKIRGLFQIKKENKEDFTKLEKAQMQVLNISLKSKKESSSRKQLFPYLMGTMFLIYGIIILLIGLPFII